MELAVSFGGIDAHVFSLQFYATLNTAAPIFGKSANERMTSFQERKARLIETARIRYMANHGLS